VFIGDTEPTSLASLGRNTLCATVAGQASVDSAGFRVTCTSGVSGRYVVVQLRDAGVPLTLCEAEPQLAGGWLRSVAPMRCCLQSCLFQLSVK
jgi:hypothetical protein